MLFFSIIFSTISVSLHYDEFYSLFDYLAQNIRKESQLDEKINKLEQKSQLDEKEDSDKYTLIVGNVKQLLRNVNFSKAVDIYSDGKYYAYYYESKKLNLTYKLPTKKCIKELKFNMPKNISTANKCNWVNNFDNRLGISGKKIDFKGEWKTDKCIETQKFSITSFIKNLGQNDIICFGDLEITD